MNNINPRSSSELHRSLQTVKQLRRSSVRSAVLMSVGVIVVLASVFYSATRLRPLEQQILEKQQQIEEKKQDLKNLEDEIARLEADRARLVQEGKVLQNQSLEYVTKETAKPVLPAQRPTSEKPHKELVGWAYYGLRRGDGTLNPRYFKKESANPNDLPIEGDRVIAVAPVNMRTGYIEFDPAKGWTNKPLKAVIRSGERFRVLSVERILDDYIWVNVESAQ